jgi:isopentenyl-diphosphate delta-isomerase
MTDPINQRKDHHIDLCLTENVEPKELSSGLGGYRLEYDALPEMALEDVALGTTILGRTLRAPIIVGAMTGGTERARALNTCLARAAARVGVGMGLGSQRAMIHQPHTANSFSVRDQAPDLPLLIGNVGAVQLNHGVSAKDIQHAVDAVGADALTFHLNPLQEAIQPGGDTNFRALRDRLVDAVNAMNVPCLVKEVGAGISEKTARKLATIPLAGVESAGVGGTSWAQVESYRAPEDSAQQHTGRALAGFGVPTALSIRACRRAFGDRLVIGSGGIRTGMDIAVALAMGADVVALARPLLEASSVGEDAVVNVLENLIYELRVICFCTGSITLDALRKVRVFDPPMQGGELRGTDCE